jgi:hypothetical protein
MENRYLKTEDRYIILNNTICVADRSLINKKLITASYLKKNKYDNNIKSIVRGGNGRKALTAFYELPTNLQDKIIKVFGFPPEIVLSEDYVNNENKVIKNKKLMILVLKIIDLIKNY